MSLNRYAKRRDPNEPEIVKALHAVGCSIKRLDDIDLLVGWRGQNFLLEVKAPKGDSEALARGNGPVMARTVRNRTNGQ